MVDSGVRVKISYKNENILDDDTKQLDKNDLKELISILRDSQRKTNECLTRLTTIESETVVPTEGKSDGSEDYNDDHDDDDDDDADADDDDNFRKNLVSDVTDDVAPKRAKLKN